MKTVIATMSLAAAVGLAACGNVDSAHLVFGQQQTVGLTIAGAGTTQDAELTLGYKDKNIAVVPVAVKEGDTYKLMGADTTPTEGGRISDSFSTLGRFDLDASAPAGPGVKLGKFFATGNAAQTLAQGFADELAGPADAPK